VSADPAASGVIGVRAVVSCAAVAAAVGLLLTAAVRGEQHPDFSGRWTAGPPPVLPSAREASAAPPSDAAPGADFGSGWGRTIILTRTADALTIEWPHFSTYDMQPPLRFVYALDGSETVNTVMIGRGAQAERSRAEWSGNSLVITTMYPFSDSVTGRTIDEQVRRTLTLDSPTSLSVETVRAGIAGGPSSRATVVYTRGDGK
jgi:hypothetical protein